MAASYRFVVTGRVQGVGFREAARRKARQLGISGWVMNRADGAVEGLAWGDEAALGRFSTWLSDGPPAARVLTLEWKPSLETATGEFMIR
jgi:acylphosphatase